MTGAIDASSSSWRGRHPGFDHCPFDQPSWIASFRFPCPRPPFPFFPRCCAFFFSTKPRSGCIFARPYLTGKFLLQPDPSELMPAVTRLFSGNPSATVSAVRATAAGAQFGNPARGRPAVRWKRDAYPSADGADHEDGDAALDELPEALQEQMLLNELLSALMGYPGR